MKAQFQITIPKRAQECAICRKPFVACQEIHSQIWEEDDWIRKDTCVSCFSPKSKVATWKQTIGSKPTISAENRDHIHMTLTLLSKLIDSDTKTDHEEAFLLALYLCRKKVLTHRVKMGLYENLETGEMFLIPKIDFTNFSAHAAQLRLQEKL